MRRAEEDRLAAARAVVAETERVGHKTSFEVRTVGKIQARIVRDRVAKGKKEAEDALNRRRAQLSRLLENERRVYEAEIEASFETPEQAKERMFARARQLQAQREAERRAELEKLELKRFRQQSDLLRACESKQRVLAATGERAAQLDEKEAIEAQLAAEEREFAEKWEAERLRRAREEEEKERKRREAHMALKADIDSMVELKRGMTTELDSAARESDRATLERWSAERQAVEERARARKEREREEYERVVAMNVREEAEKRLLLEREKAEDVRRLQETLAREAEQARAERDAKEAAKRAAQAHRKALEEQMAIEAEETSYLDDMQKEFEAAMWKKRQDQWDVEAEARRRLMEEVDAGRKHQMRLREEAEAAERARAAADAEMLRSRIRSLEETEASKRAEQAALLQAQQAYVLAQMEDKERRARLQAQQDFLEGKLMAKEEARYVAKVQTLLADPAPETQFRRKAAQWYS